MTHLQALRDALLAAPSVTALVGSRIYAQVAPQGAARPFLILSVVSEVPYSTHTEAPADLLEAVRVQVDSYGTEYAATRRLARAVDGVVAGLDGPEMSATREGARDFHEGETGLHRVSADYLVHREAETF